MNTYHNSHEEMQAAAVDAKAKHQALSIKNIQDANNRFFQQECAAAGIDPARGVSPSLLKLLGWRPDRIGDEQVMTKAETAAEEPIPE